jgi:hypothetical protein
MWSQATVHSEFTNMPFLQGEAQRKGKVDTFEEYQCLVSRLPTLLLLTQKWYDSVALPKPQGLDGIKDENFKIKPEQSFCIKTYSPYLNHTVLENSTMQYCNT